MGGRRKEAEEGAIGDENTSPIPLRVVYLVVYLVSFYRVINILFIILFSIIFFCA